MVLTMKLTTFAWNVWDGRRPATVCHVLFAYVCSLRKRSVPCRNWTSGRRRNELSSTQAYWSFLDTRESSPSWPNCMCKRLTGAANQFLFPWFPGRALPRLRLVCVACRRVLVQVSQGKRKRCAQRSPRTQGPQACRVQEVGHRIGILGDVCHVDWKVQL